MDELMTKMLEHGFAVAVAAYLLIRMDRRLEELKNSVMHLAGVIESRITR